ncbi:MAG TPA: DUF169 domain-containing protein [Vicinamibacterales bacterium]|nr:DUF169 domain-containing protein [Vicinamibacterales bacterium]HPW21717.1 DUF169 domain-containing protein [Vicinamibacterales bacterium]
MESKLAEALRLASQPVAVFLADEKPEGAVQFAEGGWGCVAASMVAVAKGRTAVFDRRTFGCPGGGTGLGFGNQYERTGFAIEDLLSTGSPERAARLRRRSRMAEGERFFASPELVGRWLGTLPFTDVPAEYVVMRPLGQVAEAERPEVVVFLVNPDQLSALVTLSDFRRGSGRSVVARFGGACQSILFAYAEAGREQPRGVIGFFDIAQRARIDRDLLSFTAPWALFLEMESNVKGSFLEMEDWLELRARS